MNVAIINVLAKSKSTGKIAYGLYKYLVSHGYNAVIYYGREDGNIEDPNIIRVTGKLGNFAHAACSLLFGNQGEYSMLSTLRMIRDMKKRQIEEVFLLNIHGYYLNYPLFFYYARKYRIKIIYMLVDEYAYHAKCAYTSSCRKFETECSKCPLLRVYPKSLLLDASKHIFYMKKRAYRGNDITFVGIDYAISEARKSAILDENAKFAVIDEAIDVKNTYYPRDVSRLRKEMDLEGKRIMLNVAPYSNRWKGCRYYIEAARKLLTIADDIVFIHVGFDVNPNICPPNYIPINYENSIDKIAEYYSMADLFVFTSYAETISSSCLEALACGTPLLVFDCCGMPTCTTKENMTVVRRGDVKAMCDVIRRTPMKTDTIIKSCRDYAVKRYDNSDYFEKLEGLLYT